MTKIPAIQYRGGTSKGPRILTTDPPQDRRTLDAVLRVAMDSPHPPQFDSIGGTDTKDDTITLEMANTIRTCRKLFDGNIFVPSKVWDGSMKACSAASLLAEPERTGG